MSLKNVLNQIVKKLYPNQMASLAYPCSLPVAKPQFENVDLSLAMEAISELE